MEQWKIKENIVHVSATLQGTPVYRDKDAFVLHRGANQGVGLPWGVHEETSLF